MTGKNAAPLLQDADIVRLLQQLPQWTLRDGAIERRFKTANFKATLLVTAAVGHLCEAAWHHPELVLTYNELVVRLWTHTAKGVTAKDFELAEKIEAFIGWRPDRDGGALTGPPRDPRFAYLRDDDQD